MLTRLIYFFMFYFFCSGHFFFFILLTTYIFQNFSHLCVQKFRCDYFNFHTGCGNSFGLPSTTYLRSRGDANTISAPCSFKEVEQALELALYEMSFIHIKCLFFHIFETFYFMKEHTVGLQKCWVTCLNMRQNYPNYRHCGRGRGGPTYV